MNLELTQALNEIFQYYGLLDKVVEVSMNIPEEILDKVFAIYQEFVEMVQTFESFNLEDIQALLDNEACKFNRKPFFPVIAGLFINALLTRLFEQRDQINLNLEPFCLKVINDARDANKPMIETFYDRKEIGFSLDFIGYLLPSKRVLEIKGAVGDYCGALMGENSMLILNGIHGNHFGYEKDPTAKTIVNKP